MTEEKRTFSKKVSSGFDALEEIPLQLASRLGPWLTPLIPAYFISRAMVEYLNVPVAWSWVAAAALEVVGIATVAVGLKAATWNQLKRKSDPDAPIFLNSIPAIIYYITALLVVLVTEVFQNWGNLLPSHFVPAAFVILSGASAMVIVLNAAHRKREEIVAEDKAKRSKAHSKPKTKDEPEPELDMSPVSGEEDYMPPVFQAFLDELARANPQTMDEFVQFAQWEQPVPQGLEVRHVVEHLPVGKKAAGRWLKAARNGND